jgi:LPXTG-motif cell wall-anchored protein
MHLIERYGVFLVIPLLFIVVGVSMFVNIAWGPVTGGPRAFKEPGAPYLYDRFYYLLFLVAMSGWSFALLSFSSDPKTGETPFGFLLGWGICAIGMGSVFFLRRDMMMRGARYLADNGFWPLRIFHRMQIMQFERQPVIVLKVLPIVFVVASIGVILFSLFHLPAAFSEVKTGTQILINVVTAP